MKTQQMIALEQHQSIKEFDFLLLPTFFVIFQPHQYTVYTECIYRYKYIYILYKLLYILLIFILNNCRNREHT